MIDYIAGIYGAFAVLAALRERDRTGRGQRIDVAMLDCALAAMASFVSGWLNTGMRPQPSGNTAASGSAASGVFETAHGKLGLAANQDRQFAGLARVIGREDLLADSRFASDAVRRENRQALREILDAAFATASAADWEDRLSAAHVPAGAVREIPEILASEQVRARGVVHALRGPRKRRDALRAGCRLQAERHRARADRSAAAPGRAHRRAASRSGLRRRADRRAATHRRG
jgi:crotonobetainyl-CoA:carnitine CoA-transferase CaiB-like acyl-CoA transferase